MSIRQFRIILWKNFVLQKRKPCVTVFEILLPVAFAVLLIILRTVIITKDVTEPYITEKFNVIPVFAVLNPNYKFFFAPDKPAVVKFMERVSNHTLMTGTPCKDEADLLRKFEQTGTDALGVFGGIIVEGKVPDDGILPGRLTFKIRPVTGKDDEWFTRQMYPFFRTNEPRTNDTYGGRPSNS